MSETSDVETVKAHIRQMIERAMARSAALSRRQEGRNGGATQAVAGEREPLGERPSAGKPERSLPLRLLTAC